MAAGMDHVVEGPHGTDARAESRAGRRPRDGRRRPRAGRAPAGRQVPRLRLVEPALACRRCATRSSRRWPRRGTPAGTGSSRGSAPTSTTFWERADVELDGDTELQQAVRFALFHTLQAGARAEQRAIAAKGLTGPGYDGHTFWDTERFVLPVLTYTAPEAAARRAALAPRDARPRARARARSSASRAPPSRGARSAARSARATGPPAPPRSTSARDIADAVVRYQHATGDEEFEREVGLELLVETARLWRSLGHHDAAGPLPHRRRHRPRRVQRDRRQQRLHEPARAAEPARRRRRGRAPPAPRRRSSAPTSRRRRPGATPRATWSSPGTTRSASTRSRRASPATRSGTSSTRAPEQYPLLLHFPYFDLYRKQVVKQADLVLALHVLRRRVQRRGEGARLRLLRGADRPRLLALGLHAGGRRGRGRPPRARLRLLRRGRADGPARPRAQHARRPPHRRRSPAPGSPPSPGFGGMRDHGGELSFAPRLPARLERLAFRLVFRGTPAQGRGRRRRRRPTRCSTGQPLEVGHHGETITVSTDGPVTEAIPPAPSRPAPSQPPGRAPATSSRRLSAQMQMG